MNEYSRTHIAVSRREWLITTGLCRSLRLVKSDHQSFRTGHRMRGSRGEVVQDDPPPDRIRIKGRCRKKGEAEMKRCISYLYALMLGILLWAVLTPYAKEHRHDRRTVGGEMLMPVYCVAATAVVRNRKKISAEMRQIKEREEVKSDGRSKVSSVDPRG